MNYSSPREKLIRDKIGEKILASHESRSVRIVRDIQEKIHFLTLKFTEELNEFYIAHQAYKSDDQDFSKRSDVLYEAADILEVLDALISLGGADSIYIRARSDFIGTLRIDYPEYQLSEILDAQEKKRDKLGGFVMWHILTL